MIKIKTASFVKNLIILIFLIIDILYPIGGYYSLKFSILMIFIFLFMGITFPNVMYYNSLFNQPIIEKPKWSESLN